MTSGFLWLAATTGLLSLLTPCVFPMVPVTIAYFSAPEDRHSSNVRRALLFGLGIIGTFTVLGLALDDELLDRGEQLGMSLRGGREIFLR